MTTSETAKYLEEAETLPVEDTELEEVRRSNGAQAKKAASSDDAAKKRPPVPSPDRIRESAILKEVRRDEDMNLRDWLGTMGDPLSFRVYLSRLRPESFKGVPTKGSLGYYEEPVDEDVIRREHGGGTYTIKVHRKQTTQTGGERYVFFQARQIHVAGNPRIDNLSQFDDADAGAGTAAAAAAPAAPQRDPLVDKAWAMMVNTVEDSKRGGHRDLDITQIIETATRPLREVITKMETRLEAEAAAKLVAKPTMMDQAEERLLTKLIDDDTGRLNAVKQTYESELRQLKENHREDEKRLIAEYARDRDRVIAEANSRIAELKAQHEMTMTVVKGSLEIQLTFANKENDRLQRELTEIRKELNELRGKKDKPLLEQVLEIKKLKDELTDDDDGKDEKGGTIERLAGKVMDSDIARTIVGRIVEGPPGAAKIPVGVKFLGEDGRLYVNNGQAIVAVKRKKKKDKGKGEGGTGKEGGGKGGSPADAAAELDLDPGTVALAVTFFETSFRGGKDPATVADSARTMAPPEVLRYIGSHGVDALLDQVAGLDRSSPLSQQAGRNWVRKVAKALLGD